MQCLFNSLYIAACCSLACLGGCELLEVGEPSRVAVINMKNTVFSTCMRSFRRSIVDFRNKRRRKSEDGNNDSSLLQLSSLKHKSIYILTIKDLRKITEGCTTLYISSQHDADPIEIRTYKVKKYRGKNHGLLFVELTTQAPARYKLESRSAKERGS